MDDDNRTVVVGLATNGYFIATSAQAAWFKGFLDDLQHDPQGTIDSIKAEVGADIEAFLHRLAEDILQVRFETGSDQGPVHISILEGYSAEQEGSAELAADEDLDFDDHGSSSMPSAGDDEPY